MSIAASTPIQIRWYAITPELEHVSEVRRHAVDYVRRAGAPKTHLDDVERVIGELAANAVQATLRHPRPPSGVLANVGVGVRAAERFTLVAVRDPVPVRPRRRQPYVGEDGDMHGLGLGIVAGLSAVWWTRMRRHDKTVVAVVARPGLTLTASELAKLR